MDTAEATARAATLESIAQRVLRIETLEKRWADHLDFHDCSVHSLKEALEAAFDAGMAAAKAARK